MSERDSSLLPSMRERAAPEASRRDAIRGSDARLQGYLRVAKVLAQADAVAWVQLSTSMERCRVCLGIEHYNRDVALGPLLDLRSGWLMEPAERARTLWPSHPLVEMLSDSGSIVARIVSRHHFGRAALCVVSRQPKLSLPEQLALDDLVELLADEAVSVDSHGIDGSSHPKVSMDVSELNEDVGKPAWLREITEQTMRDGIERLLSARLRTLVDSMDSGILVEDEQDVIQHCNQHFCDLMEIEDLPQSLLGQPSPELIERISPVFFIPEALTEGIIELKAAKKVVKDELVYLADMRILERSYSPLELDGKSVGHLWTYRDVTVRERNKDLLQRQADELRALSLVDELTGLYNRRGFLTLATQQLKLCDRSLRSALIVFVDLDGMKRINDDLGHEVGDQALVETASVLRQAFRYSDVVARLGGDEFVVLAVEADSPISSVVSDRLYEKLAEMNKKPNRKFELKFSVGIAAYDPSKSEMVEEVLARADGLMYEQKRLRKCERTA